MTTASLTNTDVRTRDLVLRQLEWDPEIDAGGIGVTARDGAVTLTGFIDTYSGKLAAERAAKRVRGVRAVANDIQVTLKLPRTDADIASDVVRALQLNGAIPVTVQAVVHNAHVILTGNVTWPYQQRAAERAVRYVRGVRHVMDRMTLTSKRAESDVRVRIIQALHRNASVDASHIRVTVAGDTAILTGTVGSWFQREAAERAAADAPGIVQVENRLMVESRLHDTVPDDAC